MLSAGATPMLLSLLVGLLIGLLGWGVARQRLPRHTGNLMEPRDDLLLGFLVLAAFSLGGVSDISPDQYGCIKGSH